MSAFGSIDGVWRVIRTQYDDKIIDFVTTEAATKDAFIAAMEAGVLNNTKKLRIETWGYYNRREILDSDLTES